MDKSIKVLLYVIAGLLILWFVFLPVLALLFGLYSYWVVN